MNFNFINKLLICLSVFFILFGIYAQSANKIFNSDGWSQEIANPFITPKVEEIFFIKDFSLNDPWGGYISYPKTITLNFKLLSISSNVLKNVETKRFSFSLKKNKKIIVSHKTKWTGNSYQSKLFIPQLKYPGQYNISLKIEKLNKEFINFDLDQKISFSQRKINLIFLIDDSGSMVNNDPHKIRFIAIKNMIQDSNLKPKIGKVGIIKFTDRAEIISPLVDISELPLQSLGKKKKNGGVTDFNIAFKKVKELYQSSSASGKTIVVFLTDGETSFTYNDEHKKIFELGIPIFTIGLHQKGKKFNYTLLKRIAQESGGSFSETQSSAMVSVYKKIVEKSFAINEKILVYPNKNTYLENEVIMIRYVNTKKQFNKKLDIKLVNSNKIKGEILYHIKNQNGGEIAFFHFQNYQEIKKSVQKVKLHFYEKSENNKRLIKQHNLHYQLDNKKPPIKTETLFFKNISLKHLDVRYFNLKSLNTKIEYINLRYLPFNETNLFQTNINFDYLSFLETPFTLEANQFRKQAIVFKPLFPTQKNTNLSYEGYLLIESVQGYFVYNLTYTINWLEQKKIISPNENDSSSKNYYLLIFLIITSIIFLINLGYLRKSK